jgi:transposase
MRARRIFSPKFKAELVLKIIAQEASSAELCRSNNIAPEQVSVWKNEFIAHADRVFISASSKSEDETASRIAELERMLGRLTMENEILKKTVPLTLSKPKRNGSI